MNPFAFDLNFPYEFLNKNFNYRKIIHPHSKIAIEECLSTEILDFFQSLDVEVTSTELFFKRPKSIYDVIHIDESDGLDRARLNYVIEDNNSLMGFFKPKFSELGYITKGAIGGTHIRYALSDMDLIYEHTIKKPSIIQTAIPHAILNPYGIRYSLAIYFLNKRNNSRIKFNEAREIFQNYIVP
jgi:hypothetical protein